MLEKKFDTKEFGYQRSLFYILSGITENINKIDKKLAASKFIEMIETDKQGDIFTITIGSNEAEFSKQLVESLLQELERYQIENTNKRNTEAKLFIQDRIINTEKDLKKAEEILKDFRDRNRRIENSPALLLEQQRLKRQVAVLTGVFTTLKQQLETTKIEEVKKANSFIVIDKPEAPVFYSKPNKKRIVLFFSTLGLVLGLFASYLIEVLKSLDNIRVGKLKQIIMILSDQLRLNNLLKK